MSAAAAFAYSAGASGAKLTAGGDKFEISYLSYNWGLNDHGKHGRRHYHKINLIFDNIFELSALRCEAPIDPAGEPAPAPPRGRRLQLCAVPLPLAGYARLRMRFRSLLTALGLNAIPAAGWFLGDWSAGTTLVLYWFETLLGTLLVAARILVHRRVHPCQGHQDYRAPNMAVTPGRSSYLSTFLVPALVFTLAHGLFLAALGFMAMVNHLTVEATIERGPLLVGLAGIASLQGADFFLDLINLRDRSFAGLERLGQQTLARVFVIHLTIIGGMVVVMFTGAGRQFFGVFIFLKTLLNCSAFLPQWQPKATPKAPPAWLSSAMDRVKAPKNKDTTFAEFWKKTDDQEAARVAHNEGPPHSSSRRK